MSDLAMDLLGAAYESAVAEVRELEAARQAWAIRAAEESARADALLEAAEKVYRDSMAGSVFAIDDLGVAIEAAKVKHGE